MMKENILTILGAIAAIVLLFIFYPVVAFWFAYFGGWLASLIVGDKIVAAFNILFNTTYFQKDMLPMMAGALGFIGGYFKSVNSSRKGRY